MFGTRGWSGLTAAVSLRFAIERMQRSVKGTVGEFHTNTLVVSSAASGWYVGVNGNARPLCVSG